jgi:streptomycin 6-kinase
VTRSSLAARVDELARAWRVAVEETLETQSSLVAFGRRGAQAVVLKVVRRPGDEWRCGEVLAAFEGQGTARVYEHVEGAVLLERLRPGTPLVELALDGRDEEATEVLARVIERMARPHASAAAHASPAFVTVEDWGRGFGRYLASGDEQIPRALVEQGRQLYSQLCATQRARRLLHGDLQHYNVLHDAERGWLAIDPKGVIGETEYELGAALRNPCENPALFATPEIVLRRLRCFESALRIDPQRALAWAFAQAVLSAIWGVEDGFTVTPQNPSLLLADALRPLVSGVSR